MTALSRDARLATWIAEEQAIRNQLAAPGILSLAEVATMSPMDFFDGIGRGNLPSLPINAVLDFTPVQWASGLFVFQGAPDQRHYNPLGSLHGGYIATLRDSCMGCAVHTLLKTGLAYTTADLRVSYIRALRSEAVRYAPKAASSMSAVPPRWPKRRLYDVDERLYASPPPLVLFST